MKKILVLALCLIGAQSAQAGFGLLAGVSFHDVSTDNTAPTPHVEGSSKLGFIGGFAFSSNTPLLNLEVDALYDNRTQNILGSGVSSPAIHVPVLIRFSLIPSVLDLGVGPYGSFNVGSNDLGYDSPDFGAAGSVRVTIPTPGVHLVVDGRYNWGFSNLSQIPGLTLHTREFQVMAGIDVPIFGGEASSAH